MGIINKTITEKTKTNKLQKQVSKVAMPKKIPEKKKFEDPLQLEIPKTDFSDIVGLERVKKHLKKTILQAMEHPELFKIYRKQQSAGIILYGPPGTGKTALVRALAGEAHLHLIVAKINDIVSAYTGDTEKKLHEIFEQARRNAPCIMFFDELDALGAKRSSLGGEGTAAVMRLAINQFLTEMDGIDTNRDGIFIIGATNAPWSIDAAFKRSGRFDSALFFPPANYIERRELFKYYLNGRPLEKVDYGRLSRATAGYSQADIKRIADSASTDAIDRTIGKNLRDPHRINTIDVLNVIRDKELGKNSIDPWFREVMQEFKITYKREKTKEERAENKKTLEDRVLYKELFNYIEKRYKSQGMTSFVRTFSIYLK